MRGHRARLEFTRPWGRANRAPRCAIRVGDAQGRQRFAGRWGSCSVGGMKRREMIQVASGTAIAHTVVTVLGCAAAPKTAAVAPPSEPAKVPAAPVAATPVTPAHAKAAELAAACAVACETCLEHCIRDLATGSTMMADCAKIVQQMQVLCRAMASLAAMGSPYAKGLAPLCIQGCIECRTACEKHAGHHAECKACAEACAACEAACRALV